MWLCWEGEDFGEVKIKIENGMKLRYYQQDALKALDKFLKEKKRRNPLLVLPTASGKSLIIASFINKNSDKKILLLTHRRELIQQNYSELKNVAPNLKIDIYSASLSRKELASKIIMASIQSYYNLPVEKLGKFDYIIIDECHLVSPRETSQYLNVLRRLKMLNPRLVVVGLSATPYRLDSGVLTEGKNKIFDEIAYEISITELLEKGYLCPMITRVAMEQDLSKIKIDRGDYNKTELEDKLSEKNLVRRTIKDLLERGKNKKSWIIFAAGKRHLKIISNILNDNLITHVVVYSGMSSVERRVNIELFKRQKVQALVNIDILTTGFNATNIDLIAMLRPTKSTALYVQMVGRGFRKDPCKKDCLILDYSNNIKEHGCVDAIKTLKTMKGLMLMRDVNFTKKCHGCHAPMRMEAIECKECGKEYEATHRHFSHESSASELSILAGNPTWLEIKEIEYRLGTTRERYKNSLRIIYHCKNYSTPIELKFFPLGSTIEKSENKKEREDFASWLQVMSLPEKRVNPEKLNSTGTFLGDTIRIERRLIAALQSPKHTHQPKSILVIKNRSDGVPIILDYDFHHKKTPSKTLREGKVLKDEKIKEITKIIKLYNQGFEIERAVELAKSNLRAHNIRAIIRKEVYSDLFSNLIISKEDWGKKNLEQRLKDSYKIRKNGCWTWIKSLRTSGNLKSSHIAISTSAILGLRDKRIGVKKYLYEKNFGKIGEGLRFLNKCRDSLCINPHHLYPVTQSEIGKINFRKFRKSKKC